MTETLDARSEILARIRSAIGRNGSPSNADQAWQAIPRSYRQAGQMDRAQCIERFAERLRDYGVDVTRCQPDQISSTIADRLRSRNKRTMLISRDVDPTWLSDSRADKSCSFLTDDALTYQDIDCCDGVLTGCRVGIAETGTLGICHGPDSSRRALTLIPDYHLCVIYASSVVETVPEAVRVLELCKNQAITLISGPSATVDIEMTRIQGVHGPRVLDVAIVA